MSDYVTRLWNKGEAHGYTMVLTEIRHRLETSKGTNEYSTGERAVLYALEASIEERLAAVSPPELSNATPTRNQESPS